MTQQQTMRVDRRAFFGRTGLQLGPIALAAIQGGLGSPGLGRVRAAGGPQGSVPQGIVHPPLEGLPHFAPTAKSIIYLHMNGGPSQIDLWDYKPALAEQFDKDLPDSIRKGQRITTMTSGQARLPVAPSKFAFKQHGESGRWVSELLARASNMFSPLFAIPIAQFKSARWVGVPRCWHCRVCLRGYTRSCGCFSKTLSLLCSNCRVCASRSAQKCAIATIKCRHN